MKEYKENSLIDKRTHHILFVISGISFIGIIVLLALTTTPFEDTVFFFSQIQTQYLLADVLTLILGFFGFLYYFILPGLTYILTLNPIGLKVTPKRLMVVLLYSSLGNYFGLWIGMIINTPIVGLIIPLLLFCLIFIGTTVLKIIEQPSEPTISLKLEKPEIVTKLNLTVLMGILVIALSFIIRFIMFNANVIEYSDIMDYDLQVRSISMNDFFLNPDFAARAPLYAMYAYLFSFFVPTYFASLKIVSFMFSFILLIPAYSIVTSLFQNSESKKPQHTAILLLLIYPWTMLMASVALQDILLTFYVMGFIALILQKDYQLTLLSSIPAALAFLSRYSLGILGPLGFLYIIIRDRKKGIKSSILFSLSWAIIVGSWIVRNLIVAGVPFSTTDEGLFEIANFIPGLRNIAIELLFDRIGMNTLAVWIPVGIFGLLLLRSKEGRNRIKDFFTWDYIFIFLIVVAQILTIATFRSQQYRFLLSVIWLIPLLWLLVMEHFEIPGRLLLKYGWILFSVFQAFHLNRIYWVFDHGRLPAGRYPSVEAIIETIMPTIMNWMNVCIAVIVPITIIIILKLLLSQVSKNEAIEPSSQ
ncbi:MAG: hypothetical protein RTV72_04110 [Candidatus Thorarchaeota archaeon]